MKVFSRKVCTYELDATVIDFRNFHFPHFRLLPVKGKASKRLSKCVDTRFETELQKERTVLCFYYK